MHDLVHRGLGTWYNVALVSFLSIAIALAATVMSSGFSSSDATKKVLEEAAKETRDGLEIVGKITGSADVSSDKILVTATPITVATGGSIDITPQKFRINYKLIKINSHTITYDNIHAGTLDGSYNSIKMAVTQAKKIGLIETDPYVDEEKPTSTNAFIYWIINLDSNNKIETGELAILAIVYAEKDRPSTGEHVLVEGIIPEGSILKMERIIPNISDSVVDIGGKISTKS